MPVPTVQRLTTSGTYTSPGSVKYIEVYIMGGGGGGSGGGTTYQGSGGGPGQVIMEFFQPGVYAYTIGAGGSAGAAAGAGGAGGTTTFNGISSSGGSGGQITDATAGSSALAGPSGTMRLGMIGGVANTSTTECAVSGGTNMFTQNGRGVYSLSNPVTGDAGGVYGGGGSGGNNSGATGGAGGAGGCIVIEYY